MITPTLHIWKIIAAWNPLPGISPDFEDRLQAFLGSEFCQAPIRDALTQGWKTSSIQSEVLNQPLVYLIFPPSIAFP